MKYGILMILLGAMVFVSACDKTREEQIRPVAVYALAEHDAVFTAKFPSIVEAGNEAVLSFKVAGSILEFPYETGAYVQKGQVLVRLGDVYKRQERDYAVQLEAGKEKMLAAENAYLGAKAQADNARKQFARAKALYMENALAKKKY